MILARSSVTNETTRTAANPHLARWNKNPFHDYLGLTVEEAVAGTSRLALRPTARTPQGVHGSVHGGVVATMVDMAAIVAITTIIQPGEVMGGTAELNVSYLRPALAPVVYADGRVIGRTAEGIITCVVDLSDGAGRQFAAGRVQYLLRGPGDA